MIDLTTKLTEVIHSNGSTDLIVERAQDCNSIADYCKSQRASGLTGSSELKHVARIPNIMIEAYINTKNITSHEFYANPVHMHALLIDPTLSDFRIWEGRV